MKIFKIGNRTKLTFAPGETVVLPADCRLFSDHEFGGYRGSHGLVRTPVDEDGNYDASGVGRNLQIHRRGEIGWHRNIKHAISNGMVEFECPDDGLEAMLEADGSLLSINGDCVNCAHASYTYCPVCGIEDSERLGEAGTQKIECYC